MDELPHFQAPASFKVPRSILWVICVFAFAVVAYGAAPSAPTIVSVVAGNAQATVNFLPSASNGGTSISYYTATAYQSGVATNLKNTSNANGTAIVVTGLTNGTSYTFVLTSTNTGGTTSANSPASTTVIPSATSSLSTAQDFKTLSVGNLASGATPSGWGLAIGRNTGVYGPSNSAATVTNPPLTLADLHLGNTNAVFYAAIVGAATPFYFTDPATATGSSPFKFPLFTPNGLLLNDTIGSNSTEQAMSSGANNNAMVATKTYTVTAGEISANDGRAHVRLALAPILNSGGHPYAQQPYEFVQIQNMTNGGATLYTDFNSAAAAGVPWLSIANTNYYTDWQMIDWSGPSQQIKQGDVIPLIRAA